MITSGGTATLGLYDLKRKIDAFGGVDYFRPNLAGGYLKNARVMLANGDIVKSTIDGNTSDPNNNMATWDQPYNVYDFKTEQPIQWYFNKYENWDDAIFEAQCNILTKGFSPTLKIPSGIIRVSKPIMGGDGLRAKLAQLRPDIALPDVMPPLILEGCSRMTEGRPEPHLGTQIVFTGIENGDDMTWRNFGIIHSAPQNYVDFQNSDFSLGSRVIIRNLNIMPASPNGEHTIHGIVIRSSNQHIIDNVVVYACNGAGIYLDWVFDSSFNRIGVLKCGRMSNKRDTYIAEDKTDIQYQTYAPIHIHASTTATDNSNFLYFQKVHLEDNNNANADIIVTGNSDPVIFYDVHFETDGYGVAAKTNKSCFALGGYGVKYFGQDSEANFDYKNFEKTVKSGHIVLDKATLYTSGYSTAGYQTAWSGAMLKNCGMALPMYVQSYNSGGGVTLDHSSIGDFVHEGFTDRGTVLSANHSTIGNILLGNGNGSGGSVVFTSSTCGRMSIGSNSTGAWADYTEIKSTNTSFSSITGNYPNFTGDILLTSEDVLSDFSVRLNADIDIRKYAYFENMGGV